MHADITQENNLTKISGSVFSNQNMTSPTVSLHPTIGNKAQFLLFINYIY